MLAYSAVAHAGYALLGVLASERGLASVIFYTATYALTTLGAFGVVAVVQERVGDEKLTAFAGLSRRAPVLALCMLVFMLSLAGIPPLAGFFGKFYVFTAAASAGPKPLGLLWLVILALAMSVVSLYYYLQVLKQIYVVEPAESRPALNVSAGMQLVLGLVALGVVVLGCAPGLLLSRLQLAVQAAGF